MAELTPEEREQIYHEELARHQAEEQAATELPYAADRPTKREHPVRALVLLVVLVTTAWAITQSGDEDDNSTSTATAVEYDPLVDVVYEVTGSASSVDITMTDGNGSIEQATGKAVPLCTASGECGIRFQAGHGDFLSISAQNSGDDGGTVTCRITADGVLIDTATSSGQYVIASCSGTAP